MKPTDAELKSVNRIFWVAGLCYSGIVLFVVEAVASGNEKTSVTAFLLLLAAPVWGVQRYLAKHGERVPDAVGYVARAWIIFLGSMLMAWLTMVQMAFLATQLIKIPRSSDPVMSMAGVAGVLVASFLLARMATKLHRKRLMMVLFILLMGMATFLLFCRQVVSWEEQEILTMPQINGYDQYVRSEVREGVMAAAAFTAALMVVLAMVPGGLWIKFRSQSVVRADFPGPEDDA